MSRRMVSIKSSFPLLTTFVSNKHRRTRMNPDYFPRNVACKLADTRNHHTNQPSQRQQRYIVQSKYRKRGRIQIATQIVSNQSSSTLADWWNYTRPCTPTPQCTSPDCDAPSCKHERTPTTTRMSVCGMKLYTMECQLLLYVHP